MLNITVRLAVRIAHIPEWSFDWSDTQPQRSQQCLTIDDFLPNAEDAEQLRKRAIRYLMEILVTEFRSLAALQHLLPQPQPIHPVQKSEVAPMKILFKDEKYKDETIDILTQLTKDAKLTGDPQVYNNNCNPDNELHFA